MNANTKRIMQSAAAAAMLVVATQAAADIWEPGDNTPALTNPNSLMPFAVPQVHDLANVGGTPDQDWSRVSLEQNRSYDVSIGNSNLDWFGTGPPTLQRFNNNGSAFLQTGTALDTADFRKTLRWIHTATANTNMIKVTGSASMTAASFYDIVFRETTLFCPRFNNTNGQISVLIVQRAANDRAETCTGTAFFLNEDQAVIGTQALTIGGTDINVYSLPGIVGLANQKGGAQLAHTCGVGGLKAKLVALEPATGFSFDTVCSPRDQ